MNLISSNSVIRRKIIKIILFLLALAVSAKFIFMGFTIDESFHVTMSYRSITGDRIFGEMWEVYATSSFLCSFLEYIYFSITGSTEGIVIFLRICGVIIQALVSLIIYRTIKIFISNYYAVLISLCFFIMYPKQTSLPEFANMQQWFVALMLCSLYMAWSSEWVKLRYIVFSAICYSLCILSYPSIIFLTPFLLFGLCFIGGTKKFKINLCFWGTCLLIGCLFILYIQLTSGLAVVLDNFAHIISGDGTHLSGVNIMGQSIWRALFFDTLKILEYSIFVFLFGYLLYLVGKITFLKNQNEVNKKFCLISFVIIFSYIPSFVKWFSGGGYDSFKIYHVVIILVAVIILFTNKTILDSKNRFQIFVLFFSGFVLFSVVLVSNVPLTMNVVYLQASMIVALIIITVRFNEHTGLLSGLLLFVLAVNLFVSGITVKDSPYGFNIFIFDNRIETGAAKGIYVCTELAEIINKQSSEYIDNINEGERVLIIANTVNVPTSAMYLLKDVKISNYSTNSTPVYNEVLEVYWEKYPDRFPDVVIIDKSYGTSSNFGEGIWAYKYIRTFYDLVVDGEYINVYRKK